MLKCIIVDDEKMAIKVLANHIEYINDLELVGEYGSAMEAFVALQTQSVDILFLDIQMPKITGLNFLKSLQQAPHVILTTAHREYALEGYEMDVVDYLLKPISLERFLRAVSKVFRLEQQPPPPIITDAPLPLSATRPFIYLKCDREYIKVALDDLLYIESLKNHVRLFTAQQKLSTLQSISQIEEKLPQQYFLRIHRSFIVAIHKIDRYSHTQVQVGEYSLPIGRLYKKEVLQRLNEHIL